jgi:hypothetical protein
MVLSVLRSGILKINVVIFIFLLEFLSLPGVSQSTETIDLKEIPQRKVRRYIASREIDKMQDFSLIHASCEKEIDESDYNITERVFCLKYKLSNVWECYNTADPNESWNSQSVRFGLLIAKHSNSVLYVNNSSFPEIETGQVYFLNLRLLGGLFNVPVAFEIINVDPQQQIVEFSYLDNNKSRGKQTIQFFDNGDGRTRIVHRSYFKSNSLMRDDFLYPFFHRKFIKEFHGNMKHLLKNSNFSITAL